jgi:hypothetical protein
MSSHTSVNTNCLLRRVAEAMEIDFVGAVKY